MRLATSLVLCTAVLVGCSAERAGPEADLVITGGTLIDGTGAPARSDVDIFVHDGKIVSVAEAGAHAVPPGAETVDGTSAFIIPGLADMHVHFSLGLPGPRRADETEEVLRRFLYYGVTTVLNVGASDGSSESIKSLWARQESGELLAPTIYGTGGHLNVPGTHPVWTIFPPNVRTQALEILERTPLGQPADLYPLGLGISLVRSVDEARIAVRERADAGMHAIKITVESGPSEFGDDHPLMPVEMIAAIVDEAAKGGMRVLAHVSSPNELDSVLVGGAGGVVHTVAEPPFPDSATADLMRTRGFFYVPTLSLHESFIQYLEDPTRLEDPFLRVSLTDEELEVIREAGFLDASGVGDSLPRWRNETQQISASVAGLHAQGVLIAVGTDVGNPLVFPGFTAHQELALLVRAGLTPMQALMAATARAAEMIGESDGFGTIEPGKRADLLILDANPLEDIANTRAIQTVVANGHVVDRATLLRR